MYDETMTKTVALGQKLDIVLTLIRLGFFYTDHELAQKNLDKVSCCGGGRGHGRGVCVCVRVCVCVCVCVRERESVSQSVSQ
jgi:hypothetical protein